MEKYDNDNSQKTCVSCIYIYIYTLKNNMSRELCTRLALFCSSQQFGQCNGPTFNFQGYFAGTGASTRLPGSRSASEHRHWKQKIANVKIHNLRCHQWRQSSQIDNLLFWVEEYRKCVMHAKLQRSKHTYIYSHDNRKHSTALCISYVIYPMYIYLAIIDVAAWLSKVESINLCKNVYVYV